MRQVRMEALKMAIDIAPEQVNPITVVQISEVFVNYMIEGPGFLQKLQQSEDAPSVLPETRKQRRKKVA